MNFRGVLLDSERDMNPPTEREIRAAGKVRKILGGFDSRQYRAQMIYPFFVAFVENRLPTTLRHGVACNKTRWWYPFPPAGVAVSDTFKGIVEEVLEGIDKRTSFLASSPRSLDSTSCTIVIASPPWVTISTISNLQRLLSSIGTGKHAL